MRVKLDKRFFPLIFNTISHGIFTIDEKGRITSFNRAAEDITGYSEEEVIGRLCSEIFLVDICEECPLKQSIQTRERTENREVTIETKVGRHLSISISTAALVDEKGHVIGGVEMFRDISSEMELKKSLFSTYVLEDIITKSPAMKTMIDTLPLIAGSQSTVLIEGESGTGKELVARAIHNLGPRHHRPFVAINCASIPETLIESELFGYKKGAFTDAKKDKPGRFARAEKGTLFLDEVAEIPNPTQAKLLRVLEEKEFEPLGATAPVKSDVRIVAATNKNLAEEVQKKRFRQDLYFCLNVVPITLPPLRERREDIPILVKHFIDRFNAMQGRRIARCSERVMAALMAYPFEGNVRELENAIEHAFVVCGDDTIQLEDLPPSIINYTSDSLESSKKTVRPFEEAEANIIRSALERHNGNRERTAAELGISRVTLWRKSKQYNIL